MSWDTMNAVTQPLPVVRLRREAEAARQRAQAHAQAHAQARSQARQQRRRLFVVLSVALLLAFACAQLALLDVAPTAHAASTAPLLPGETLWSGVPSDLLGAGDTWNYLAGFESNAGIQAQVKAAHVPLIRAFFMSVSPTDHTTPVSDAHQLAIAQAIQKSGAQCMANLTQPVTVAQALHLVSILSPYCKYFEVYNEPDLSGMWPPAVTESSYMAFWNSFVPQARAQFPGAYYGGPTLAAEFGLNDPNYMQDTLRDMAASGVAPDFITYHWYICSGVAQSSCLADTAQWTPGHGKTITGWLASDFPGRSIPQGITEWSADPGNPAWAYDDTFMAQFEQAALSGLESNPYLSFATQFNLAAYAGYGSLDLFRLANPEASGADYTNTATAIGSPRPMFGVLAAQIAALSGSASGGSTPTPPSTGVPRYDHVITILEENHSYGDIIGSSSAPYINGALLTAGALATNYTANVQSSLPNYMALTGGTTLGWTSNCEPDNCSSSGPSIMAEATASGQSWRMYEENMPQNCQNAVDGGLNNLYTVHHNPAPFYTAIATACQQNDVNYSQLATDLQSPSSLPAYVFVTPNLNDDMHNGTISQGDTWLSTAVPTMQHSPACQQSRCLIAITWDEGSYDASGAPLSPHVATILLGPDVQAGARDATAYSHYNLLHTEEAALGLPTMTSHDAGAALMLGMFTAGAGTPPPPTPTPSPPPSPSPTPSPTPPSSGTLFSDTFEQDALGSEPTGWTLSSGTWQIASDGSAGGSHVLRETTSPQASSYVWAGSDAWTDYTLTASVKPDPNNLYATYNLMGRYLDTNNHYSLILKNHSEWWLGVKHLGVWRTLATGTFSYSGQFYTLSITFSGSKITASVNGTTLATATDATFSAGAIAFNTNAGGELDNVSVVAPGGVIPPPPPPPTPTPSPTPAPLPINNATCTVVIGGSSESGTCSGTFTPA